MSKNLVICLDGTGARPRAAGNTNVVRLYSLLDLSEPERQIAYYDPGVGTMAAAGAWTPLGRWWSRTRGMAFGAGIKENLGEAYTWLMRNWEVGDRVYVFGFSRGAYSARALVGLLRTAGLLRPGAENFVPYVVAAYSSGLDDLHALAETFARRVDDEGRTTVPVHYLGLWDTVKKIGVFRRSLTWPYTRGLPNAERIRHAVAIDEHRPPFREYLIDRPDDTAREEAWFAGAHSDVGGTFEDDGRLSSITLKWIADGAIAAGLRVRPAKYRAECAVDEAFATGAAHESEPWWLLFGTRRRPIPPGARLHASVGVRRNGDGAVGPAGAPPVVFADPEWTTLLTPRRENERVPEGTLRNHAHQPEPSRDPAS